MAELTKSTTTTHESGHSVGEINASENQATSFQTWEYLTYFFFGIIEILIAFRLVLRITGASVNSGFVGSIYSFTNIFISPFQGIFSRTYSQGLETTSIFEPSAIVAILVYAVLAWGIVQLIRILSGKVQPTE